MSHALHFRSARRDKMTEYTFVVEPTNLEITVTDTDYASAHEQVWAILTDEQRNNCSGLDCVEQIALVAA